MDFPLDTMELFLDLIDFLLTSNPIQIALQIAIITIITIAIYVHLREAQTRRHAQSQATSPPTSTKRKSKRKSNTKRKKSFESIEDEIQDAMDTPLTSTTCSETAKPKRLLNKKEWMKHEAARIKKDTRPANAIEQALEDSGIADRIRGKTLLKRVRAMEAEGRFAVSPVAGEESETVDRRRVMAKQRKLDAEEAKRKVAAAKEAEKKPVLSPLMQALEDSGAADRIRARRRKRELDEAEKVRRERIARAKKRVQEKMNKVGDWIEEVEEGENVWAEDEDFVLLQIEAAKGKFWRGMGLRKRSERVETVYREVNLKRLY